jgi:membrane dipeptidase
MIDISHPSKQSMMQTLELTRAPIIASHSGARALCDHSRNLDDEQLRGLARNGGVVQNVAFSGYVRCDVASDPARSVAMEELAKEFSIDGLTRGARNAVFESMSEERLNVYLRKRQQIVDRRYPGDVVSSVSDFVDHIDHAVKVAGVDHVGISSDFDGGGGVDGWRNAEETFNVTLELVKRGYSEEQIAKIWGGNLLRVLEEVELVANEL